MKQLFTLLTLSGLLGCATPADPDDGQSRSGDGRRGDCIFESSIRGYSVLDESNLVVSASNRRNYHVVLTRRAIGLDSSWGIGFDSPTGSVCAGFAEVVFSGHLGRESIRIETIRELNEDEHEDLLIRFGKKEPEIERKPAPQEVDGAEVEELDPDADPESGN